MWRAIQSLFLKEQPRRPKNYGHGSVSVCALVVDHADRATLTGIEEHERWNVRLEDLYDENSSALRESPVIVWDRDLPCDDWRDVVHALAQLPHRPCVLLLSRVVDDYLWNEVVSCGGYDVLAKPLREVDVVRSVRLAWSYWASAVTAPARAAKAVAAPPTR